METKHDNARTPNDSSQAVSTTSTLAGEHAATSNVNQELSSPIGSPEKNREEPLKSEDVSSEASENQPLEENVYPSGIALISVALALILSIFLIALDLVSASALLHPITPVPRLTSDF